MSPERKRIWKTRAVSYTAVLGVFGCTLACVLADRWIFGSVLFVVLVVMVLFEVQAAAAERRFLDLFERKDDEK